LKDDFAMSIDSPASDTPPDASITEILTSDAKVWDGLKLAIAQSSGFERWKQDRQFDGATPEHSLETLVHRYLRETLETLAY
jgi:hypothetical protein